MSKEQRLGLATTSKAGDKVAKLKKALKKEKKARKRAERHLKEKSKALVTASSRLKDAHGKLKGLLENDRSKLDGAFVNIIDPYVVMDLNTKVLNMNSSAKDFLGFDHTKETIYLSNIVHEDYVDYTAASFKSLLQVGIIKNYNVKLITKYGVKFVNINASLIYGDHGEPVAAQGVVRDITKEEEIKVQLEQQKRQQDIIVENSSLGILLIVEGKIVKANKTFVDLIGYSKEELKGMSIDDVSTIEDIRLYEEMLLNNNNGQSGKFAITRKFHKKNGASIWGKTSMSIVKNAGGQEDYRVAMIEDVTSDKRAEERLQASEQRLSTLIANLQTGVLLEDEQRKLVLANDKFCELFNFPSSAQQLIGADCKKYWDQYKYLFAKPDKMVERVDHILATKQLVLSDELELADGRTFERDYIPLFIDDVYKGHLWTYNDITYRKNYRKNLEKQKEKYSSIINNMNLGLIEIDQDHRIKMVNSRFAEMMGMSAEALMGQSVLEVMKLDEDNFEVFKAQLQKRKENQSDSYEVKIKTNDDEQHWLISGAPTYNEAGEIAGSIGVHLDITKQKELELQKQDLVNELEESNKGLQEYAHIVSHDLKSPLRSVTALATWLYEDYSKVLDEDGKYNLKMMLEKVEGMDRLIDGILKYSTVNNGTLDHTEVDVNEVIQEISEIIYIPEHVKIRVVNALPTIHADRVKVHQLFQNFLSNAVVNIDKPVGLVEISSKENKTHWQFAIKDNGVGIPKEYHEKIFRIFQSLGNNDSSTGIGLSIVKKIIDLYEGKVWLESEIGVGTTFFFTIKKQAEVTRS